MRTPPAAVVALPGRRRFGASAAGVLLAAASSAALTLSVQDTPMAARRIGVSWTLKPRHRGSAR